MTVVRMYRMTISSIIRYSKEVGAAFGLEMHYKVARRGAIRSMRRKLAKRGVPHFQQHFYRRFKWWIPKRRVKVNFEREKPTLLQKSQRLMNVERGIKEYVGKRWTETRLKPLQLHVTPRRRKKRVKKREKRRRQGVEDK